MVCAFTRPRYQVSWFSVYHAYSNLEIVYSNLEIVHCRRIFRPFIFPRNDFIALGGASF